MSGNTYAKGRRVAGALLAAVVLAGCSGLRTYPNDLEKNLDIRTETDSGSIFSKVRAEVDIFRLKADRKTEYQGTVNLSEPSVEGGVPPDELSYMAFRFSNSSFLANSRTTMSHETLLKARAGYNYGIKVSYIDDINIVTITEKHPRNPRGREIALRDITACKALVISPCESLYSRSTPRTGKSTAAARGAVRKHGKGRGRRHIWRKLNVGMDVTRNQIVVIDLTTTRAARDAAAPQDRRAPCVAAIR